MEGNNSDLPTRGLPCVQYLSGRSKPPAAVPTLALPSAEIMFSDHLDVQRLESLNCNVCGLPSLPKSNLFSST